MEVLLVLVLILLAIAFAGVGVLFSNNKNLTKKLNDKKELLLDEDEAIKKASDRAKSILLDAQNKALETSSKAKEDARNLLTEVEEREKQLDTREKKILERSNTLDQRFDSLESKEKSLEQSKRDVKTLRNEIVQKLEKVAGMTRQQAEKVLREELESELSEWTAKKIKEAEFEIQAKSDEKSKEILIDVMQKSATDYVAESTSTTIDIDNEDLKGKIIGKEGRNIRTFERLTGVDFIVDEAPNQVTLSSFDPVRREVAALTLQKLLKDGRIHPGSIEQTVNDVKRQIAREIRKNGEQLAYEAGFNDLPLEIIKLLGRFKYRFSYGQNLAKHTLEMIKLSQQLASELGADVKLSKKACLLHDIGKVLTHEIEGKPHHHISGDIVRKYLKDEKLANAVEAHHGDIEAKSLEAEIVKIADAISGARPGARRNTYEEYIQRVKALEDIAKQYDEVHEAYAIHAGREVRVIIQPKEASDEDTTTLAHKIAKEIEETQNYPGTVTVTAIREFRAKVDAK
ncbi:ribonuclease Y [Candidatus Dojkabacteria bacterium]|nr:ribonuclease Y [Candidatus Dojkabacteria bacterium]